MAPLIECAAEQLAPARARRGGEGWPAVLVADQRPTHDLDLHHRSGPLHQW